MLKAAREQLEILGGKLFNPEEGVKFQGTELILPAGTTAQQGILALESYIEEQGMKVSFNRVYNYRPWDVAYNAMLAMKRNSGMVSHRGTFLSPPQLIDVQVGLDQTVQVPWGVLQVPSLPNVKFQIGSTRDPDYGIVGTVQAAGPKRDSWAIQGMFDQIEDQLRETSIYRGKAIDGQEMPNFIDVEGLDENRIVYSAEVMQALRAHLFTPLAQRQQFVDAGLGLKRAILLHGEYGTGKTLALMLAGKIATTAQDPWTFILVRPGRDSIEDAMQTARIYSPTLVAFEDVDTVANAEQESTRISQMLDLFDGMDAKTQDVMVVLTTNHVEAIHKGMLRPGRLDHVLKIGAPDTAGVTKMMQVNSKTGVLADEIDWDAVGQAVDGYLPSFIVRTAQVAAEYLLARRLAGETDRDQIETEDLIGAAFSLRHQWELHQDANTGHEEPELDRAVKHLVQLAIENKLDDRLLVDQD